MLFDSPGRDLSNHGRGFPFGVTFVGTPPPKIDQHPYPHSGLSQRGAGFHAFLWSDQIPNLRIYVVIAV